MSEEKKNEILDQAKAVSDKELGDVAGGKECYCVVGGGGTAEKGEATCMCVAYGVGDYNNEGRDAKGVTERCTCYLGGGGDSFE